MFKDEWTTFFEAYLDAAVFTDQPDLPSYDTDNMDENSYQEVWDECTDFIVANEHLIGNNYEQAGHDFWLTRNRHGTGFWDREEVYGAEAAAALTEAAHAYGESHLMVDDDGNISVW